METEKILERLFQIASTYETAWEYQRLADELTKKATELSSTLLLEGVSYADLVEACKTSDYKIYLSQAGGGLVEVQIFSEEHFITLFGVMLAEQFSTILNKKRG